MGSLPLYLGSKGRKDVCILGASSLHLWSKEKWGGGEVLRFGGLRGRGGVEGFGVPLTLCVPLSPYPP